MGIRANSLPNGTRAESDNRRALAAAAKRVTLKQKRRRAVKARSPEFVAAKGGR